MTGALFLDWASMAVSLFNTILLSWLGLTMLLNAERRSWGIWLAGGSLLAAAIFFISHTAILGHGSNFLGGGLNFWWRAGWGPALGLPLAWYVLTLWYGGFWETPAEAGGLRARQGRWLALVGLFTAGLLGLLLFANPLPSFSQVAQFHLSATPSIGGIPLLILAYPVYIVLCISLSLDALGRPGPSARVMGDLARRRARPWLMAAAGVLLAVSLLVAGVMIWIVISAPSQPALGRHTGLALAVGWFDLIIAGLIAVAVVLVGQAIAAYEVFTGQALPRRGLLRQWHNAVILAGGYGVVVGWSLTIQLRPIYSLLLTALIMTGFYALFSWRTYAERERSMRRLRPFVASQRLYQNLVGSDPLPSEVDVATPFRALCRDVLGARTAYLAALGPAAAFAPPLAYPEGAADGAASAGAFALYPAAGLFDSAQALCLPVDPAAYGGAVWAVPLWSEGGPLGVLLLGEKSDGGLYTQEEIEIARANGERLIDIRASAEIARRLMALQRQRLAESQVHDGRARRVLHDDVLPELHAAMLALTTAGDGAAAEPEPVSLLAEAHRRIADLLRAMPGAAAPAVARLGLFPALRQTVEAELGDSFAAVAWEIDPEAERHAARLPPLTAETLFFAAREAARNSARHGRGESHDRSVRLRVSAEWGVGLVIVLEDDGAGAGAGGRPAGGVGQGLALHSTLMAVVGGTLTAEPVAGGMRVTLRLPLAG